MKPEKLLYAAPLILSACATPNGHADSFSFTYDKNAWQERLAAEKRACGDLDSANRDLLDSTPGLKEKVNEIDDLIGRFPISMSLIMDGPCKNNLPRLCKDGPPDFRQSVCDEGATPASCKDYYAQQDEVNKAKVNELRSDPDVIRWEASSAALTACIDDFRNNIKTKPQKATP